MKKRWMTGEDIHNMRRALGETQAVFGSRFRVTRRTVIRWEACDMRWMPQHIIGVIYDEIAARNYWQKPKILTVLEKAFGFDGRRP